MKIPLTDLKLQYESIKDEIDSAIKEVITNTDFILGKEVGLLEEEAARYFGVSSAVGVASGTDALGVSLAALGIGEGDQVITTPFTFIATAEAICRVGAQPVFSDIDYTTYNIDPEDIEAKITKKTKAIIPVHLYGLPCQMDRIISISKEYNLKIVEDCAQAFGAEYKGKKVGTFGDCGALSFFPAKLLGGYGDGGMVITGDKQISETIKILRNHGSSNKYYYSLHGFNSRLDTLQAAILRVKLKHIEGWIKKRIENALYYNKLLSGIPGIITPLILKDFKHSFNYYTIRVKKNRSRMQQHLKEKGIAQAVYYPLSLHLQEVYKSLGFKASDFPVSIGAQEEVLSLPMYPELTQEQMNFVAESVKEAL